MSDSIIPNSYEAWKHCITVKCKIPLTEQYINERLQELENTSDYHTQQFVNSYGDQHRQRVIRWFQQAKSDL